MARRIRTDEGGDFSDQLVRVAIRELPARAGYEFWSLSGGRGSSPSLWLSGVTFISTRPATLVGTVLRTRPRQPRSSGWRKLLLQDGAFFDAQTGRPMVGAQYVRLEPKTALLMGPIFGRRRSRRRLNIYNPARETWIGDMGGINYRRPSPEAIAAKLEHVWRDYPGAVVLDGTDDWFAPESARPELFEDMFGIDVLALWHTGASGKSTSGIVLSSDQYELLNRRYRTRLGHSIEHAPSKKMSGSHSDCGCWDGSAFVVYHDPRSRRGTWRKQ
jgi:hypothetical protein